jgi:hypothetical protein
MLILCDLFFRMLHYPDCIVSDDWMTNQLVDNLEGSGRGLIEVKSYYLPERTEEDHLTRSHSNRDPA